MELKECEKQLEDIAEQINKLLYEREEVIKAWHKAFDTECTSEVRCIYEKTNCGYALILINGNFKLTVSEVWDFDFEQDLEAYYKQIEHGIWKYKTLNKRSEELSDWQRNLIYAKAAELRKEIVGAA